MPATSRGARERAGAEGRLTGAFWREPSVAGETPRTVDEHADADALALRIVELLDTPILRRDLLTAPHDGARVGVLGAGTGSRIDRCRTQVAHRAGL